MKYCFYVVSPKFGVYQQGIACTGSSTLLYLLTEFPNAVINTHIEITEEEFNILRTHIMKEEEAK